MRHLLKLLFIMTLSGAFADELGVKGDKGVDIRKVCSVVLAAKTGWTIMVFEDGSAKVEYGSGPLDNAEAVAGTVNFSELRQLVVAQLQPPPGGEAVVSAAVRNPGQASVTLRPLRNPVVWNRVVVQLNGKLRSVAQNHFDALIVKVPLNVSP